MKEILLFEMCVNFKECSSTILVAYFRKALKDPRDAQGVPTRTLILVRHGQYDLQTGKLTPLGGLSTNWRTSRFNSSNCDI